MKYQVIVFFIGWCLSALPIRAVNYGTHHCGVYSSGSWTSAVQYSSDISTMTAKPQLDYTQTYSGLSLSEISAQNFENLNSNGGAFGGPMYANRRPDQGDGLAIGETEFRSPVGDALLPLLIMAIGYMLLKAKQGKRFLHKIVKP